MIAALLRQVARFPLFHNLRFRLILLVIVATLPALVLLFLTASQQRSNALDEGQQAANRLVQLAALNQRRIFAQAEQTLTTIARLPQVRSNDAGQCAQLMAELLSTNRQFENLAVVNRDGSVFCSGVGTGEGTVSFDHDLIERTFTLNDFVIGGYQSEPELDAPIITAAAPVTVDTGMPQRLVYAALDPGALNTVANLADLPDGAVFSVYDRDGVLLFRYPAEDAPIGESFAGTPVVQRMREDPSGLSLRQYGDAETIYAGQWIRIHPEHEADMSPGAAFIVVALPKDATVARANESFQNNLTRLGLAALVAVVLAWVGADLFMARDAGTRKSMVAAAYQVFETGDLDRLDDIMAHDVVDESAAPDQELGLAGYKQLVAQFRAAFPNGTIEPDELLADNDKVVARVTLRGTHVAEFFGSPPSGEDVEAHGVETYRFANGMIVEMWSMFAPLAIVQAPPDEETDGEPPTAPAREDRTLWQRVRGLVVRETSS